jgi:hypothetical protein
MHHFVEPKVATNQTYANSANVWTVGRSAESIFFRGILYAGHWATQPISTHSAGTSTCTSRLSIDMRTLILLLVSGGACMIPTKPLKGPFAIWISSPVFRLDLALSTPFSSAWSWMNSITRFSTGAGIPPKLTSRLTPRHQLTWACSGLNESIRTKR